MAYRRDAKDIHTHSQTISMFLLLFFLSCCSWVTVEREGEGREGKGREGERERVRKRGEGRGEEERVG